MAKKTTENSGADIFLYHGADDAVKRKAVDRLAAEIVDPDYRDFDFETQYGPDVTADRLILAAGMAPFASRKRLILITQANDIPTPEQQIIAGKLDRFPDTACVVFVTPAPEMDAGKPKHGSELHVDLLKAIRKVGKSLDFPLMKDQSAIPFAMSLVKQSGKTISPTAAAALVHRCGTDSGVITTEVAKLVSYVEDRKTITDSDVALVTTETVEEKIFALTDAVGLRDAPLALKHLHAILGQGGGNVQGEALRTLVMLARQFRYIWQARTLMDAGIRAIVPDRVPEYLQESLPSDSILKKSGWQLEKIVKQAGNFTMDELVRCFERITAADLAIKGVEGKISDGMLALEMLVVEIVSIRTDANRGRHIRPSP